MHVELEYTAPMPPPNTPRVGLLTLLVIDAERLVMEFSGASRSQCVHPDVGVLYRRGCEDLLACGEFVDVLGVCCIKRGRVIVGRVSAGRYAAGDEWVVHVELLPYLSIAAHCTSESMMLTTIAHVNAVVRELRQASVDARPLRSPAA